MIVSVRVNLISFCATAVCATGEADGECDCEATLIEDGVARPVNVEVNVELLLGPGTLGADGVRLGSQLRELEDDPNGLSEGLILNEYVELFDMSEGV